MIYALITALAMGFFGSLHCIGMCGGLVSALTMSRPKLWWGGLASYQAGRILTYSALGIIAGMIGAGLHSISWFDNMQTVIMALTGLMMVAFGLNLGGWMPDPFARAAATLVAASGLGRLISQASGSSKPVNWGVVGLMNGLLPCGLVYAALTLGIASGSVMESGLIMLAFGLGTIPAMTFVPVLVRRITPERRGVMLKVVALLIVLLGVLMMFRGTSWMHQMMHGGGHQMQMGSNPMPGEGSDHPSMHHSHH